MGVSCSDMLEVESSRQLNDPSLNQKTDSVFYAYGILQAVQQLADQYYFQNEMRGDLVKPTDKASVHLQSLAAFRADASNKYDSVYRYYKVIIGDPNPDIYGNLFLNLNWKRFTLGAVFNYSLGNDVYNYQRSVLNSGSTLYNQQVAEVGHWRYENQEATLPRVEYGDPMGNNRFSDRWIEDGSYLRLKNVQLSYVIPIPEAWQSWLQGISVWAEGGNLFTLTKYTGSDPEFSVANSQLYQGIDAGTLAQGRTFSMGVKINL